MRRNGGVRQFNAHQIAAARLVAPARAARAGLEALALRIGRVRPLAAIVMVLRGKRNGSIRDSQTGRAHRADHRRMALGEACLHVSVRLL